MPTPADLKKTPVSGYQHIDALLDSGPDWNYQSPGGNTIFYTFSIATNLEPGETGQVAFDATQQAATRQVMNEYIAGLTGINFVETSDGSKAQVHFCYQDIPASNTSGLCSWYASTSTSNGQVVGYSANAYIYLDNNQFASQNFNLAVGSAGRETLLHEIGHMLGLKHPFDTDPEAENVVVLPAAQDSTLFTLMSYKDTGGPYSEFRSYDVAALNWIYGRDGLGGALGVNSTTGARYLTGTGQNDSLVGTAMNDTLRGDAGDDNLDGGAGQDTAVFKGLSGAYSVLTVGNTLQVSGVDGIDILTSVELFQFDDGIFTQAQLRDSVAPTAPTLVVPTNVNGFIAGPLVNFSGIAEANATIRVFSGATLIGTTSANAQGFWSGASSSAIADGSYTLTATATDAAGNVSPASAAVSIKVDETAPVAPTISFGPNGNQPVLSGVAEAGTVLVLEHAPIGQPAVKLGQLVVGSNGAWSVHVNPLPDGQYRFVATSTDSADNASRSSAFDFNLASPLNRVGTAGNDILTGTAANNALSGGAGIDTALYTGARADYTITRTAMGHVVASVADGLDSLVGVERIQFGNASLALDIDGNGGEAYRLYRAAFDRTPDSGGVGFWISRLDNGVTLNQAAEGFIASQEFRDLYGDNPTDFAFVSKLYQHVLHRGPDGAGFDFWVNALAQGVGRAEVLANFSESAENEAQVIAEIQNGFGYTPFG